MHDWSNDLVLRALQDLDEPVGSLVRAFPGRAGVGNDADWLDTWFVNLARRFAAGEGPDPKQLVTSAAEKGDLSLLAKPPVQSTVRLVSIRLTYFRGFRITSEPIRLDPDLVVIEGRNSSGKTSLSEAIEWVFTGELSRRTSGEHGHPSELAGCIANEFRPNDEPTSVELCLNVDGEAVTLKRVLKQDYSSTASELAVSELWVNGRVVTSDKELELRDDLFAGVHPILMQHNLRRFVHDDPSSRRQYFERLLQIDGLTALIEKAVVGPTRLRQIHNPEGGTGLSALRALAAELEKDSVNRGGNWPGQLKKLERLAASEIPDALSALLVRIAKERFPAETQPANTLAHSRDVLAEAQRSQREARLPLLAELERSRAQSAPVFPSVEKDLESFKAALVELGRARDAAVNIATAQQELARVADELIQIGLIDPRTAADQVCPLCEHDTPTLTPARIGELASWTPLARSVELAETATRDARIRFRQQLQRLRAEAKAVAPPDVPIASRENQLSRAPQRIVGLVHAALRSASAVRTGSREVVEAIDSLLEISDKSSATPESIDRSVVVAQDAIAALLPFLTAHRDDVGHLEEAVGVLAHDDAAYRLREKWLDVASLVSGVAEDAAWEAAKGKAKEALDGLRDGLIALRTEIIEDARRTFSEEMTRIWHLLRSDSGAQFSRVTIPPAHGRGYKLDLELKASISDGHSEPEVDALRVFSESQINAIGLAAYITRARLLGHRLLIFDDPVQSMDEEHFRSFAAKLLSALLEDGFQIMILTHSDTFARRLHDHHYQRDSYATLETKASKRKGCYVLEGSRRVSERLSNARRLAADGDLASAWRLIRLAMERLYTLAYARANDDFDPETWQNLTADDMWNRGVGEIIEAAVPGSSKRLKEILNCTVAGAHDKAATGETDIVDATKDLALLLNPLRLGAG